ncbi:acyl carrier protein [Roseibium aggregatum]|uniref:acyl carrier protein n=1 Tax=Roseibium aggregatum TaxID=187304 RepID=UPI000A9E4A02|nr:acyl carrier protein [Roseibium aggregatum]UFI05710.1 acyl carrier protein [Roseibium aggregatum]
MPKSDEILAATMRSTLALPEDYSTAEMVFSQTPGWDSLAHMRLVAEIEEKFDIMLDLDDIIDMSSFAKAQEILKKYGVTD